MLTGFHAGTPCHMLLGEGLFLRDFDCGAADNADELRGLIADAILDGTRMLGATRGGGSFSCQPMLHQLDADAMRTASAPGMVNDGWQVRMTGTLLEVTPTNLAALLPGARIRQKGRMTTLTVQTDLTEGDFLPRLCWIGDTPRGFVLIELTCALNIAGAVLTFQEHGESELPFVFQAHRPGWEDGEAPFRILFFE